MAGQQQPQHSSHFLETIVKHPRWASAAAIGGVLVAGLVLHDARERQGATTDLNDRFALLEQFGRPDLAQSFVANQQTADPTDGFVTVADEQGGELQIAVRRVVVGAGDTLSSIATDHGVDAANQQLVVGALARQIGTDNPAAILPGDQLVLPADVASIEPITRSK